MAVRNTSRSSFINTPSPPVPPALQSKFPMMLKVDVNGPHAHPIFTFLKQHTIPIPGALRTLCCSAVENSVLCCESASLADWRSLLEHSAEACL